MGHANLGATVSSLAKVTGVCDVWKVRRYAAKQAYPDATAYTDYRESLEAKDIGGVIVATPPHWHALISVDATRAGKDIYVQKPTTLHVGESLTLRNAVNHHGRVCYRLERRFTRAKIIVVVWRLCVQKYWSKFHVCACSMS